MWVVFVSLRLSAWTHPLQQLFNGQKHFKSEKCTERTFLLCTGFSHCAEEEEEEIYF